MVTITQLLDLLLALVLLMFLPIGLWRGALREWLALAGIAFGTLLANEWAIPWGNDLAQLTKWPSSVAAFIVADLFFLGVTLIIGYGAGVTVPYRPDLSWFNRLLGGLLGLGNGMLILSGTLRIMQRHLFSQNNSPSPLYNSQLATFLLDYVGWGFLLLLACLLFAVVAGLFQRGLTNTPLLEEFAPTYTLAPAQSAPPTATRWADQAEWQEAPAASAAPAIDATAILQPVAPPAPLPPPTPLPTAEPIQRTTPKVVALNRPPARQSLATNGATPSAPLAGPTPLQETPPPDEAASTHRDLPLQAVSPSQQQGTNGHLPPAAQHCAVCGSAIATQARFCPTCGHLNGAAERRQVSWRQ